MAANGIVLYTSLLLFTVLWLQMDARYYTIDKGTFISGKFDFIATSADENADDCSLRIFGTCDGVAKVTRSCSDVVKTTYPGVGNSVADEIERNCQTVSISYYIMHITVGIFVFLIMPFTYKNNAMLRIAYYIIVFGSLLAYTIAGANNKSNYKLGDHEVEIHWEGGIGLGLMWLLWVMCMVADMAEDKFDIQLEKLVPAFKETGGSMGYAMASLN